MKLGFGLIVIVMLLYVPINAESQNLQVVINPFNEEFDIVRNGTDTGVIYNFVDPLYNNTVNNVFLNITQCNDNEYNYFDGVGITCREDQNTNCSVSNSCQSIAYQNTSVEFDNVTVNNLFVNESFTFWNNITYVKNKGNTPIQNMVDSIDCANGDIVLVLDGAVFNENVIINNKSCIDLTSFGARNTLVDKIEVIMNETGTTELMSFSNFIVTNMTIKLGQKDDAKFILLNNMQIVYFDVEGNDNSTNQIEIKDSFMGYSKISNVFASSEHTILAFGVNYTDYTVFQHFGNEMNGIFNLSNGSNVYIRDGMVGAFPQEVSAIFIAPNGTILNIDGSTASTANLIQVENSVLELQDGISAGVITPKFIVQDNNNGSINITDFSVFLYNNQNQIGKPRRYNIEGINGQMLSNNSNNYIHVDFNGGNPQLRFETDDISDDSSIIIIAQYYRQGDEIHGYNLNTVGEGLPNKLEERLKDISFFDRANGLIISEDGVRNVLITRGTVYIGASPIVLEDFNSSIDDWDFYAHVSGNYTLNPNGPTTTYNNLQYDDGSDLQIMLPQKFVNNFIFRDVDLDNHAFYLLGTQHNTVALALDEDVPSDLPDIITNNAIYLGRIIVGTNQNISSLITSVFEVSETISTAVEHNNNAGLQGGISPDEYYHLSLSDFTELTDWLPKVNLSEGAGLWTNNGNVNQLKSEYTNNDTNISGVFYVNATGESEIVVGNGYAMSVKSHTVGSKDKIFYNLTSDQNHGEIIIAPHTGGNSHMQIATGLYDSRLTIMASVETGIAPRIAFIGGADNPSVAGIALFDYGSNYTGYSFGSGAGMFVRATNSTIKSSTQLSVKPDEFCVSGIGAVNNLNCDSGNEVLYINFSDFSSTFRGNLNVGDGENTTLFVDVENECVRIGEGTDESDLTASVAVFEKNGNTAIGVRNALTNEEVFLWAGRIAGVPRGFFGAVSEMDFRIQTNNTDKVTIEAGGDVGVGITNPVVKLHVKDIIDGNVFRIDDNDGTCSLNPESGGIVETCSSDENLKVNVTNNNIEYDNWMNVSVRQYDVKQKDENGTFTGKLSKNVTGVVAQEYDDTFPDRVYDENGTLMVELPSKWELLQLIQEQDKKIKDLQSRDIMYIIMEGAKGFIEWVEMFTLLEGEMI